MQHEENGCEKVLRPFLETNKGSKLQKIQEFINRTRKVNIIVVNIFFCEEKQKVGLFVYHREGLRVPLLVRVPQFGNHCPSVIEAFYQTFPNWAHPPCCQLNLKVALGKCNKSLAGFTQSKIWIGLNSRRILFENSDFSVLQTKGNRGSGLAGLHCCDYYIWTSPTLAAQNSASI